MSDGFAHTRTLAELRAEDDGVFGGKSASLGELIAGGVPVPIYTASLRAVDPAMLEVLRTVDAMVVTVLAAGGSRPATAQAGGDDGAWDVGELARLDVPVIQGLVLGTPRETWAAPPRPGT